MKRITIIFLLVLIATCYSNLFAQKPAVVTNNEPGWHHIGQTTASFKMQNESISVLGADEFTALKLKVTEAGLDIERLQVFYESGDMEEIDLRSQFGSAGESGTIQLKYPGKDIQKVAFTYKTRPNAQGEKADISLYGLKTNQPTGRDSYKDEQKELKEEAHETKHEMKEEAREAEGELKEESREAEQEIDEQANEVEKDGQSVGDKIEEGAKDAASAITDQKLKDKVGPGGENAYVDEDGKYYIINNAGEKVFITSAQLKNKPDDK